MIKPIAAPFRVIVEIDGQALDEPTARIMPAVRVQQTISLPAQCECTFVDPSGDFRDGRSIKPGQSLLVRVLPHTEPLFAGEVTAVDYSVGSSGAREIRVRGYDLLHRLRKRVQVKTHDNLSAVDLIRQLISADGITVEANSGIGKSTIRTRIFQNRQTDFDLLAEQAYRAGIQFTLRGKSLQLLTSNGTGEPIDLAVGDNLLEARIECNGDQVCRSVQMSGWNFSTAEAHKGTANTARTGRGVAAEILPGAFSVTGERFLAGQFVRDDVDAQMIAQAELDRRSVSTVTFHGTADGNPLLRPGQPVKITGVAAPLDGVYTLTSVAHIIDDTRGFISELSSSPPPRITPVAGTAVTLGIVIRVDDPEKLGRLQVSLPAYHDAKTDWIGVVTAGGGKGKGLISVPDVGDQVLVLCSQEDLSQGVVVGGLYGLQAPPDTGVDGSSVQRFSFITPGGQRIRLDDGKKAIHMQNSSGSFVDLSPAKVVVHAAAELVLEAPGSNMRIRAKQIYFESAD